MKKLTESELVTAIKTFESSIPSGGARRFGKYNRDDILEIFSIIRKNRKRAKKEAKND